MPDNKPDTHDVSVYRTFAALLRCVVSCPRCVSDARRPCAIKSEGGNCTRYKVLHTESNHHS